MSQRPVPAGFAPMQAFARAIPESRRVLLWVTLIGVFVVVTLFERLRGMDWWWSTGTGLLAFVGLYIANFNIYMRAGDGWFASNNAFVRTDRLTKLRSRIITSGIYVTLADADGRTIDVPLTELSGDPKIWELVLAGVRASVSRGLIVDDKLTARLFGVPLQPRANAHVRLGTAVSDSH